MTDADTFMVKMYENTLGWLERNPHDFDSLANGPLGQALTAVELHDLADDQSSMDVFIGYLREQIVRHSKPTRWYVDGKNFATHESWGVTVEAPDRPAALAKVLRRRARAEWLLEGTDPNHFAFTVRPVEPCSS